MSNALAPSVAPRFSAHLPVAAAQAPLAVPSMGTNCALITPAVGYFGIDARVRDGKQAAPPRGELR